MGRVPGGHLAPQEVKPLPVFLLDAQPQRSCLVLKHEVLLVDDVGRFIHWLSRVAEVRLWYDADITRVNQVADDLSLSVGAGDVQEGPIEHAFQVCIFWILKLFLFVEDESDVVGPTLAEDVLHHFKMAFLDRWDELLQLLVHDPLVDVLQLLLDLLLFALLLFFLHPLICGVRSSQFRLGIWWQRLNALGSLWNFFDLSWDFSLERAFFGDVLVDDGFQSISLAGSNVSWFSSSALFLVLLWCF